MSNFRTSMECVCVSQYSMFSSRKLKLLSIVHRNCHISTFYTLRLAYILCNFSALTNHLRCTLLRIALKQRHKGSQKLHPLPLGSLFSPKCLLFPSLVWQNGSLFNICLISFREISCSCSEICCPTLGGSGITISKKKKKIFFFFFFFHFFFFFSNWYFQITFLLDAQHSG